MSINQLKFPNKYVGKYKNNIEFMSSWEKYFINYCDMNSKIIEWSSEEVIINYKHPVDKRTHRSFPDFYIKYVDRDGKTKESIIEIKPSKEADPKGPYITEKMSDKSKKRNTLTWMVNNAKWLYAKEYCKRRNMSFVILTEKDLKLGGSKK